jgi:molybdopterin converting factor small subunit
MENIKENITLTIEEKPKTETETVKQYNQRIYRAKREKVLSYKKQFYANKVKFIRHLQPIRLTGKLKRQSNTIIKKAYTSNRLILQVGYKQYNPKEFYNCFNFRDNAIFDTRDYLLDDDDKLTIFLPTGCLLEKDNCFMI